jgi:hypothetical protein
LKDSRCCSKKLDDSVDAEVEDANPVFDCPFANTKSHLLKVVQKVSQPICGGVNLISRIRKRYKALLVAMTMKPEQ